MASLAILAGEFPVRPAPIEPPRTLTLLINYQIVPTGLSGLSEEDYRRKVFYVWFDACGKSNQISVEVMGCDMSVMVKEMALYAVTS